MTLLFAFRWITKKIDGVFYELFVFLFWLTEVCVNSHRLRVCVMYGCCLSFMCVQFGMSLCGQRWEDWHATSVLMFISLLLKFDTVQRSACLNWWDNTPQTHGSESSPPLRFVSSWSDLVGANGVKNDASLKSLFVFDRNQISHSLSRIYWYSLLELSVS